MFTVNSVAWALFLRAGRGPMQQRMLQSFRFHLRSSCPEALDRLAATPTELFDIDFFMRRLRRPLLSIHTHRKALHAYGREDVLEVGLVVETFSVD